MTKDCKYLAHGFAPGDKDVIVGRGKVCYQHTGNQRLASIVQTALPVYSAAKSTKKSKSELIKEVVAKVRESSPGGGFVKFDTDQGMWYEVGDRIAKEKVSQTFRDALNDRYKSSTTSKTLKRRQERINRQTSVSGNSSSTASSVAGVSDGSQAKESSLMTPSALTSRGLPAAAGGNISPLNLMASVATSKLYAGNCGLLNNRGHYDLNLALAARNQTIRDMILYRQHLRQQALASLSFPRY